MRRNRASVQSRIAMLLTDDLPRARSIIGEAERTMRDIVRIDARPAWRRDLAVIVERGCIIRARAGDRRRIREIAQQALALMEQVAAEEPRNPQTTRALCEVLLLAADAEEPNSSAATAYRLRVAALAGMEHDDPRLTEFRARALVALGRGAEAAPFISELLRIGYRDGGIAAPEMTKFLGSHRDPDRALPPASASRGSPPA